jgi:hypothetical protein
MRAWILGAGFSASLGGPMLGGLLSESALSILRLRHPNTWLAEDDSELVVRAFACGKKADYWADAEEFLAASCSYDSVDQCRIRECCQMGWRALIALRQAVAPEPVVAK